MAAPSNPSSSHRWRACALVWLVGAAGACGTDGACPSGRTKACLSDGTTCTCAPSCSSNGDCDRYSAIFGDTDAAPDAGTRSCAGRCTCASSLCLPNAWRSGESVVFVP